MKKNFILIGVLLFLSVSLFAQKGVDYIVTLTKDTVYGKVRFNPYTNVINFSYHGDKMNFHASTIEHFGIIRKGKLHTYTSIVNDWKETVFVEVLTKGKLHVYLYDTSGNDHYSRKDPYRYYVGKSKSTLLRVSPRSYRNALGLLISDHPRLLAQAKQYEDVPKIIQSYNFPAFNMQ